VEVSGLKSLSARARQTNWTSRPVAGVAIEVLGVLLLSASADAADKPTPVKIAVFDFELEDTSPAAALLAKATSSAATMDTVSSEARRELARSGRYDLINVTKVDAPAVRARSLRNCGGCEAGIALQLGADQSLFGVLQRVTQTDYYVVVQIRDARSGKVLDQEEANFAGSEEGWASGVRMLIRHQVLGSEPSSK
jgi:hypothetical protein